MEIHPPYWDKSPNLIVFFEGFPNSAIEMVENNRDGFVDYYKRLCHSQKDEVCPFWPFLSFQRSESRGHALSLPYSSLHSPIFWHWTKSIDVQILTLNVYCLSQLCLLKTHFVLAYNNLYTLSQSNWVLCYSASILSDPLLCRPSTSLYINKLQLKYRLTCVSSCKFRSNQKNVNFSLTPLKVKIKVE